MFGPMIQVRTSQDLKKELLYLLKYVRYTDMGTNKAYDLHKIGQHCGAVGSFTAPVS